ncbi:MAG: diacylglycerol kinase family protein [Oligella ureolytica]|jgi:diacylglycerol kinase|nr:diacylglycerol kinase family protein [Oligella ureolytica]
MGLKPKSQPYSFGQSLKAAAKGIGYTVRKERHFRFHLGAALAVVLFGLVLGVSLRDWLFLIYAIGCVLVTELLNTALERAVDLASPEYKELAGIAKDIAAGAVLVAAIQAVFIGVLIFGPYIF